MRLEAAHTVGRKDQDILYTEFFPDRDKEVRLVPHNSIIPLCSECHRLYDAHRLDILPYLSYDEQANAVAAVGISRALHRLSSGFVGVI